MSPQDMDTPGYSKNEFTGHGYPLVTAKVYRAKFKNWKRGKIRNRT